MSEPRLKLETPASRLAIVKSRPTVSASRAPAVLVLLAFAAVYLIWGSTYLAIKYAIVTLPAFLMAGSRFMVAGAMLFAWAKFRGATIERGQLSQQWRRALVIGALLLLGGNGGVTWAERYISSGLAALIVATEPLWVVMWNWFAGGSRPNWKTSLGLLIGLSGVALLVSGGMSGGAGSKMNLIGAGVVLLASVSWAGGSVYSIHKPVQASAPLASAMQMLSGGFLLMVVGLVRGEFSQLNLSQASWISLAALLYLIVFGSVVAFTAYSFLLRKVSPARAATYAYVNPVVAVLLGWAIASEPVTPRMIIAASVIVLSVVLITTFGKDAPRKDDRSSGTSLEAQAIEDDDPCPTHPCA